MSVRLTTVPTGVAQVLGSRAVASRELDDGPKPGVIEDPVVIPTDKILAPAVSAAQGSMKRWSATTPAGSRTRIVSPRLDHTGNDSPR